MSATKLYFLNVNFLHLNPSLVLHASQRSYNKAALNIYIHKYYTTDHIICFVCSASYDSTSHKDNDIPTA